MSKTSNKSEYKTQIIKRLKSLGIQTDKNIKNAIRPQLKDILNTLLDMIEENKEDTTLYHSETTTKIKSEIKIENIDLTSTQQKIINTLGTEDKFRFKELAEQLNMPQNQLWNELNILLKFGLVDKEKLSRKQVYYSVSK